MPRSTEASIWITEFTTGALPHVCAKSGGPADSMLTFRFDQPASSGTLLAASVVSLVFPVAPGGPRVKGVLPLTRRWRRTYVGLRAAGLVGVPIGVLGLLTAGLTGPVLGPTWVGVALVCLAASVVIGMVYGALKPKGEIFKTAQGQRWLRLRDVHPNFASAIASMDHPYLGSAPRSAG